MLQCKFCGRISQNSLCYICGSQKDGKSLRQFFKEEKHIINLLTRDCLTCPLNSTQFCQIIY